MQVELLGLVLLQPDRRWSLGELSRLVDAPQSSVHRELTRFLHAGIVARDTAQRPHRYAAATATPWYRPLRELIELTVGVPARLAAALDGLPDVEAAVIHGSWAEGRVRPDSDLDVLVISDGDPSAARRALLDVGRSIARDVDVSVLSSRQFATLAAERNPFVGGVLHGSRIALVGELDALLPSA